MKRLALITGVAGGIGAATANAFSHLPGIHDTAEAFYNDFNSRLTTIPEAGTNKNK